MRTFLIAALLLVVSEPPTRPGAKDGNSPKNARDVEARLSFVVGPGTFVDVRLTKAAKISELLEVPLKNARRDLTGNKYEIMGAVWIKTKAETKAYDLFLPWGKVRHGETYLSVDLSKLHKFVKETLQDAVKGVH